MGVEESLTPWLLTGMGGVLGWGLAQDPPPVTFALAGRERPDAWPDAPGVRLELARPGDFRSALEQLRPSVVVHAACMSRAQDCAEDPERAQQVNVAAVEEWLCAAAEWRGFPLYVSTEQVFDGTAASYREDSPVSPLEAYGRTKAAAEERVLDAGGAVVRLPLLLGPDLGNGRAGADGAIRTAVRAGKRLALFHDEVRTPVGAHLVAPMLWRIATERLPGIFHLAGSEAVSRLELGQRSCTAAGLESEFVSTSAAEFAGPKRSLRLVLETGRAQEVLGWEPPNLRQSLAWDAPPAAIDEGALRTENA